MQLGLVLLMVGGLGGWRISNNDTFYLELACFEKGLVPSNKPYWMQKAFCPARWEQAGRPAVVSSPFLVTFCHLPAAA